MHGIGQTISTILFACVIAVIGALYGMLNFSESNQQQSANSIVQAALLDASDDNGKAVDGTMVVNTNKFEQNIKQSNIDNWRKIGRGKNESAAEIAIGIYYLDDQSKHANDFHLLEDGKNSSRKVIKGVKVVIMRLNKTTPIPAKKKLISDQATGDPQYGVIDKNHKRLTVNDLSKMSRKTTVYVTQPTDIITYLVSNHGTLKADDAANGNPETRPDHNSRDQRHSGYLSVYGR